MPLLRMAVQNKTLYNEVLVWATYSDALDGRQLVGATARLFERVAVIP